MSKKVKANSNSKCCSEHTVVKQRHLIRVLSARMKTIHLQDEFCWVELNGGAGSWDIDGKVCIGSPFVAYNIYGKMPFFKSVLIEAAVDHFSQLEEAIGKLNDNRIRLECTTNERASAILKNLNPQGRGAIYYDPGETPQYHVPLNASKAAPNLDVVVHVGAALTKRNRAKKENGKNVKAVYLVTIAEYLHRLNKSFNFITEQTDGKQQFVMIYSTNDPNFFPPWDWIGCDTEEGEALIKMLDTPKKKDAEDADDDDDVPVVTIDDLNNPDNWGKLL